MRIRDRLTRNKDIILLDGVIIGSIVHYGKRRASLHARTPVQTVYASRISGNGVSIIEEGKTKDSVLNKVASRISKAMKAGQWINAPASTETLVDEQLPSP